MVLAICIKRLTPDMVDDFLYFFDRDALTENPRHANCYCQFCHTDCPQDAWERRTAAENRSATREMILSGRMHGYLSYESDRPVGWCHADDMASFARLKDDSNEPEYAGKRVGVLVCFLVAPDHSKRGVATGLMKQACADFASEGFDFVEAYPRKSSISDMENYLWPLSMYLGDRFEIVGGNDILHIVRKTLNEKA